MSNNLFESDEEDFGELTLGEWEKPVELDRSLDKFIIVDNVPVVDASRYEKLKTVVQNKFKGEGYEIAPNGVTLPMKDGKSIGVAFIEYTTKQGAIDAKNKLNNTVFDSKHTFKVNLLGDFKEYTNYNDTYDEPSVKEFQEKPNAHQWLSDDRSLKCYDQFFVRYGDFTDICWNELHLGKPGVEKSAIGWTTSYIYWSTTGSYLATFHSGGIALYGGLNWQSVGLYEHAGVQLVDFSPDDNYMVTFAPTPNENPKEPKSIVVWDIRTGKKLKVFPAPPKEEFQWPAFQWSSQDKYFARVTRGKGISIYEAATTTLTPIVAPDVKTFSWSPSDLLLSYFVPATEKLPGKIIFLQIPSMKQLQEKAIWDATDVRMHWQNDGDYLCVKVNKIEKKKKPNTPTMAHFELFRVHEVNIPVENFEIAGPIKAFAWEPRGKKFCIISGEHKIAMTVSFYDVQKNTVKLLTKLENRRLNTIYWSPRGTNVLLANLNDTGDLEFYNTNDLETYSVQSHLQCTHVEWNPSGRYVTTYASHYKVQIDTGYNIWTFNGDLVYTLLKDRFYQFAWRPRPRFLLSTKELNVIKSNYKKYQEKFDAVDATEIRAKEKDEDDRLQALMQEYLSYIQNGEIEYQSEINIRKQLGSYEDIDPNDEYEKTETIEEIIDVQTQVLKK